MPAIRNRQHLILAPNGKQTANGFDGGKLHLEQRLGLDEAEPTECSKLEKLIEVEHQLAASSAIANNNNNNLDQEVFLDTCAGAPHAAPSAAKGHNTRPTARPDQCDQEPIVIFDGQSNTSIAQTAKDQFAAALLRLQQGLDDSTERLMKMERKMEEIINRQQQQQQQQQQRAQTGAAKQSGRGLFGGKLDGSTLVYLSWPVLVFVAMRAIERRSVTAAARLA